jgi:DNA (cytosine-5)-methyltransferase 1
MNFLSVCSGIEAASVAWNLLGWKAVAFSEIEKFPAAILAHRYPDTPNLGDMTQFSTWPERFNDRSIDLLCGGTPCQSFSVAGLRKGLDDPRGDLMLTFSAIAAKYRPKWLVWENVPGVLSSNSGSDFAAFLGLLSGQRIEQPPEGWASGGVVCGYRNAYGLAYRVLDAQYFGLAQRRKRVFVVGCLGDWRAAAAVLFERHSLQGHLAPRREKGQEIAPTIRAGAANGGRGHGARSGDSKDELIVAHTLKAKANSSHRADSDTYIAQCPTIGTGRRYDLEAETILPIIAFPERMSATQHASTTQVSPSLCAINPTAIAYGIQANTINRKPENGGNGLGFSEQTSPTLTKTDQHAVAAFDLAQITSAANRSSLSHEQPASTMLKDSNLHVIKSMQVRRLTPRECERLQGFPDDYTAIPWRGKLADQCPDGPRYKALGNSWAVPCARWIGDRIAAVNQIHSEPERSAA